LISILPKDVKILTRQEFIKIEQDYWDLRTPIGFTFKIMMFIGFIVGIGVAYQILYTNISSHLIEFATLKAIGFRNSYLLNTVFQQAILIALLGFIPGFLSSIVVYDFAYKNTALPISMTSDKFTVVFLSVIGMCVASAALAIQKLRSADPADIF
jgi:putative ABC transport system permease protein